MIARASNRSRERVLGPSSWTTCAPWTGRWRACSPSSFSSTPGPMRSRRLVGCRVARRRLAVEEGALALHAPPVSRERPVSAYDPMTGSGDGDGIGRARLRHSSHGLWGTDSLGDLSVRRRGADRDLSQRLPDPPLEGGSPDVERQKYEVNAFLLTSDDAARVPRWLENLPLTGDLSPSGADIGAASFLGFSAKLVA